jgi:hypothetical protein
MEAIVNWNVDWSNCFVVEPKWSRMRKCNACGTYHDKACFFHYRGGYIGCMMHAGSRGKAMARIKSGGSLK